ncbi:hypothetical protein V8F20_010767 [Naviculisporaceae sp. PSN 640]
MSSRILLSTSAAARRVALTSTRAPVAAITTRTFTQSSARPLKETHSDDPDPNHFEKHKQDSVKKAKAGKAHWKPELASNSEESIRADRAAAQGESAQDKEEHIRKLQERTKAAAEETSKSGTSMRDGL